jgi:hypothetical protein
VCVRVRLACERGVRVCESGDDARRA